MDVPTIRNAKWFSTKLNLAKKEVCVRARARSGLCVCVCGFGCYVAIMLTFHIQLSRQWKLTQTRLIFFIYPFGGCLCSAHSHAYCAKRWCDRLPYEEGFCSVSHRPRRRRRHRTVLSHCLDVSISIHTSLSLDYHDSLLCAYLCACVCMNCRWQSCMTFDS